MSAPNCHNQTVFIGDNLPIMRGLNSGCADLICADPPFNKKKRFIHNFGKSKQAKQKPGFDDYWTMDEVRKEEHELLNDCYPNLYHLCLSARNLHSPEMQAYLVMMAVRMIECHRLLKETGSMYLHCDPTANAYLRLMLDGIFGQNNFRNEIIWCYPPGGKPPKHGFHRKHDTILYYSKGGNPKFNHQFRHFTASQIKKFSKVDKDGRRYKEYRGRSRSYLDEMKGSPVPTWWTDIPSLGQTISKEASGWATQKPLALYSRMVLASSNPGDVVLDPFCGCATTLVAAENAGRKWIGIDREPEAAKQVVQQLNKLNEGSQDWLRRVIIREDLPARSDLGDIPHYRTHFSDLYTKQNGICKLCLEQYDSHVMEVDHKVASSKGGRDNKENLQLLCTRCNKVKGNLSMPEAIAKAKELGIRKED